MKHRKRIERLVRHFPENGLKLLLEDPGNVKDVLHLVAFRLIDRIDFTRMKAEPTRFVHRDYRHLESDVVLRAPLADVPGQAARRQVIIYILIEHQSEPDPLMVFRVLEYVVLIYRRQMQEWQRRHDSLKGFRFCPVLPVVLYTGTRIWERLGRLADLVERGEDLADVTPELRPLFLNIGQLSDTTLERQGGSFGWVLRVMQQRKLRPDLFEETLTRALHQLEGLAEPEQQRWWDLLCYICAIVYNKREPAEQAPLVEKVTASIPPARQPEASHVARTIAESLIEQGMEKGIKIEAVRARKETLLQQLRKKFRKVPARLLKRIEATTSLEQLVAWLDEVVEADSLDEMSLAKPD